MPQELAAAVRSGWRCRSSIENASDFGKVPPSRGGGKGSVPIAPAATSPPTCWFANWGGARAARQKRLRDLCSCAICRRAHANKNVSSWLVRSAVQSFKCTRNASFGEPSQKCGSLQPVHIANFSRTDTDLNRARIKFIVRLRSDFYWTAHIKLKWFTWQIVTESSDLQQQIAPLGFGIEWIN